MKTPSFYLNYFIILNKELIKIIIDHIIENFARPKVLVIVP